MKEFAKKYLSNTRLIMLVILGIIIGGMLSYFQLPRELMPSIKIPMMAIMATYPGANAGDVEELVTNKVETALKSVKGIKEVTSTSSDNYATLIITFDDQVRLDDVYNDISQKINRITDFPTGVISPTLYKIDFDSSPIWTFSLEGSDMIGLVNTGEELKAAIESNSDIDRVDISGGQNREIQVVIDQTKVNDLGINPQLIAQAVGQNLSNSPAGTVALNDYQFSISTDKEVQDLASLRSMLVKVNGQSYPLGELAAVMENEKTGSAHSYELTPGQAPIQTISLSVYKLAGRPIDKATQHAKKSADDFMISRPEYSIRTGSDMGADIEKSFNDLMDNIIATIILVFIVMLLFLGFKEALISALCIPTVMFVTYILMNVMGISMNMISLMGLLLALGMLVDNAIVVVTALHRQYKIGNQTALEAAVAVWSEFFSALLSTNLTTVWAFLPLLMMTGIMGQFMHPLPIIVTIAIIGSALVAFFISLPLGIFVLETKLPTRVQKLLVTIVCLAVFIGTVVLLPTQPILKVMVGLLTLFALWMGIRYYFFHRQNHPTQKTWWLTLKKYLSHGFIDITSLENWYSKFISQIILEKKKRLNVIIGIIVITLLCYVLPFTPAITTEMMPADVEPTVYVETEMTLGAKPEIVEAEMLKMLSNFSSYTEEVEYITADVGQGAGQQMMSTAQSNKFLLTIHLREKTLTDQKKVVVSDMANQWRKELSNYPLGKVNISQDQGQNSSFGADVQISITGQDDNILDEQAVKIIAYLEETGKVTNIAKSSQETASRIAFIPDKQALANAGLSQTEVSAWLRTSLSGLKLGQLKLEGEENTYDINFRFQADSVTMSDLSQVLIPTPASGNVPLSSLGSFELRLNQSSISHQNYDPSITITADALPGQSGTEVGNQLNSFVAKDLKMPAGYKTVTGGMNESFSESVNSLLMAMVVAFLLILMTLVLQLKSFRKSAIVMSVIPVAISGVFFVMAITGVTLSIPSIIGILALFGIVVNNSILIVERINQDLDEGMSMNYSIAHGATSRLQPILMTSLTTIIGLAPLTVSDPMWRGLGGTIIAGLMFSGTLMLLFLPILYSMWFDPEKLQKKDEKWALWKNKMFQISEKNIN